MFLRYRWFTGATEKMRAMPSELFHRNLWATFMVDTVGMELRYRMNGSHLLWSTDYPHTGCDWPNSRVTIERVFRGLPIDEVKAFVHSNALRPRRSVPGSHDLRRPARARPVGGARERVRGEAPHRSGRATWFIGSRPAATPCAEKIRTARSTRTCGRRNARSPATRVPWLAGRRRRARLRSRARRSRRRGRGALRDRRSRGEGRPGPLVVVELSALGHGGPDDGLDLPEPVLQARSGALSGHGHMGAHAADGRRAHRRVRRRRVRGVGRGDGVVAARRERVAPSSSTSRSSKRCSSRCSPCRR